MPMRSEERRMALVLAHYPLDGIRDIDISPGLFADGPWGRKLVTIDVKGSERASGHPLP
ncbi:MAG: hypothetical protein LJE91_17240 [Gammaproteobacteria bacterium]|nr:hypothetical protein [Gammaproteobacteria bacterium]